MYTKTIKYGYRKLKQVFKIDDAPIEEKTVLLLGLGKGVRGNMQYILEELNHNEKFIDYKIYVRTSKETEKTVKEFIRENGWSRTRTVTSKWKYAKRMFKSQYLITEVYFPEDYLKRDGQIYINIWHGTPLKKLGLAKNSRSSHRNGNTQRNFIMADYLLYPNEYTMKHMLEAYKVQSLISAKTLLLGYPRTGGMMQAANNPDEELVRRLAPNGEKIYAYMPTFRDYMTVDKGAGISVELMDYLDEKMNDDEILYVNLHHKVNDMVNYRKYRHIKKFPQNIDSYKLLACTQALISDYSSVFLDYLALGRQIVLYIKDYEEYSERRGMYMDIMELPFDKAMTEEEVLLALRRGKTYDDASVREMFVKYDSENNARELCRLLIPEERDKVKTEELPKDDRKKVLVFSEKCGKTKATNKLWRIMEKYDKEKSEYFVGCVLEEVNRKSAYPMLHNVPVIGVSEEQMDVNINGSRYEYERAFGRYEFDVNIIYEVFNQKVIEMLLEAGKRKMLCLTDKMIKKAMEDEGYKKTLVKAADICEVVFILKATAIDLAKQVFGEEFCRGLKLFDTVAKIDEQVNS